MKRIENVFSMAFLLEYLETLMLIYKGTLVKGKKNEVNNNVAFTFGIFIWTTPYYHHKITPFTQFSLFFLKY